VVIDRATAVDEEFTAVLDNQIVMPVQQKFEPGSAETFERRIFVRGQLNARKAPAASGIASFAAVIAVYRFIEKYPVLLRPSASEQIHF